MPRVLLSTQSPSAIDRHGRRGIRLRRDSRSIPRRAPSAGPITRPV
ncbi:hypothetical protein HMPREF0972_01237 [Actinomyces sp. oral taxon 848 str. F0332]|nr:hypothetical protein HMPREF0972_01237 [Actinomyces sp. oral taxon 848 str. F0332]